MSRPCVNRQQGKPEDRRLPRKPEDIASVNRLPRKPGTDDVITPKTEQKKVGSMGGQRRTEKTQQDALAADKAKGERPYLPVLPPSTHVASTNNCLTTSYYRASGGDIPGRVRERVHPGRRGFGTLGQTMSPLQAGAHPGRRNSHHGHGIPDCIQP